MVYHLTVEARRPPLWVSATLPEQYASRLRAVLGDLARDVTLRWLDDTTLSVVLRYAANRGPVRERHLMVLRAVVEAADRAGLYAVRAAVTRVASHWSHGAIAGALTGLGVGRTQGDSLQPLITLSGLLVGALAGALVRREVPVFRAALLPATGWRLIEVDPEDSATRFRVGLA